MPLLLQRNCQDMNFNSHLMSISFGKLRRLAPIYEKFMLISHLTKINAFACRRSATIFLAKAGKKKSWDVNSRTVVMKRFLFSGVALAALLGGSAMAADLRPPPYKAPPPAPTYFS